MSNRVGLGWSVPKSSGPGSLHQKQPFLRQQFLKRLPDPHGQRSFLPSFSSSNLLPWTTRTPRFTCVSDGYPRRRLLIVSKKMAVRLNDRGSCVPWRTSSTLSVLLVDTAVEERFARTAYALLLFSASKITKATASCGPRPCSGEFTTTRTAFSSLRRRPSSFGFSPYTSMYNGATYRWTGRPSRLSRSTSWRPQAAPVMLANTGALDSQAVQSERPSKAGIGRRLPWPRRTEEIFRTAVVFTPEEVRKLLNAASDHENVPVVDYLLWPETLRLLQQVRTHENQGRVLQNANGSALCTEVLTEDGKYKKTDNVKNAFDRLRKKEGIDKPLKSFKKTSATLVKGDERFNGLEDLFLGHAPTKMSDKHYTQVPGKLLDQAILWLESQYAIGEIASLSIVREN